MQCLWRRWQPCKLLASPTSVRKDFNPQPKLVLMYRPRKGERLSLPEQMSVVNFPLHVNQVTPPGFEPGPRDSETDAL